MAFVNLVKTSASSGGDATITVDGSPYQVFWMMGTSNGAVETGKQLAVLETIISGGANGGELHILLYRNGNVVMDMPFSIAAEDVVFLTFKGLYQAGDVLAMYSDMEGVTVEMFGEYSDVPA